LRQANGGESVLFFGGKCFGKGTQQVRKLSLSERMRNQGTTVRASHS